MRVTLILLLLIGPFVLKAQDDAKQMRYENYVYEDNFKTVLLYKSGGVDPYPVINLATGETLELSFDQLGSQNDYYQYTLIHCDASWRPTNMNQNEYLTGMNMDNINNFKFATNTYVRYVHYSVTLPNENMKPRLAGNYLIKIFRNYDESDVVITRRCYVLNTKVTIASTVKPATLAQYRFTKQEVDFEINYKGYSIPQPFQDLKVVIMQNNRADNAITDLKPQFMTGEVLQYDYQQGNLFDGGNEFRWFDIRALRGVSMNVRSKTRDTASVYHCMLNFDEGRASTTYLNWQDFNGRRVIDNRDMSGSNAGITGDYAWVNFYLNSLYKMQEGDVYIFGEFTDWQLKDEFRMRYNKAKLRYEAEVFLKQGRYEYIYVVPGSDGKPDEAAIEGIHYETENDYLILVYHRNQQFNYDELIGYKMGTSGVLKK